MKSLQQVTKALKYVRKSKIPETGSQTWQERFRKSLKLVRRYPEQRARVSTKAETSQARKFLRVMRIS